MDEMNTGVNESVVAEQTVQEATIQENTGVNQQAAAVPNESVEKAFAARLKDATEKAKQEARDAWVSEQGYEWKGKPIKTETEYKQALREQELEKEFRQKYANVPDEIVSELTESRRFREQYQTEKQTEQQKQAETKMFNDFADAYPDVKPTDIPKEVWAEYGKGTPLIHAYRAHENKQLKEQMKNFQTQQQNQNAKRQNADASPGSAKGGSGSANFISKEAFDQNKHDMNWVRKNLKVLEESKKNW